MVRAAAFVIVRYRIGDFLQLYPCAVLPLYVQIASLDGSRALAAALIPTLGIPRDGGISAGTSQGNVSQVLADIGQQLQRIAASHGLSRQDLLSSSGSREDLIKNVGPLQDL